jgi:O-antigen/teichoic acid export membrane protein
VAGRILGEEAFGKLSLALALAFIFQAILDPGLYQITIREIAREKSVVTQYLSNIIGYKVIIAVVSFRLLLVILPLSNLPKETAWAIAVMVLAELPKSIKSTFSSAFHAFEYFNFNALIYTVERFSLLVIGTFVLMHGAGVVGFCLVFAVVRLLDLFIVTAITRMKICKLAIHFHVSFLKKLLMSALPVGVFLIVLNLYTYIDTIMISAIRGDAEVGWYNAAFKIYEGLSVFPMIICTVFRPRIARTYYQNRSYFEKLFPLGIKYVLIISLSVGATGFLASDMAINLLFGEQYKQSIVALQILLCGLIFVFTLTYLQMMLITIHQQKQVLKIAVVGLGFNVLLNLFLIPRYGYVGASLGTISGELLVLILLYLYSNTTEVKMPIYSTFAQPIFALALPIALFYIIPFEVNLYLKIAIINTLFMVLLFVFKVINLKDFKFISIEEQLIY